MQHVLSCHPGREQVLVDEWQRLCPSTGMRILGEGWVETLEGPQDVHWPPRGAPLAFATQVWPDSTRIEAPSIAAWARIVAQKAIEHVKGDAPWRLHVFGHDTGDCTVNQRRLGLIGQAVWTLLKQKQRRLCKSFVDDAFAPLGNGCIVVNVGFFSATQGVVSILGQEAQDKWRHSFSRFAGGFVPIAEDSRPPARAYRKLREALAHLDVAPAQQQTWVDLGAAPGSWSFDAVEAGARIWAIDRSPLRDDLMQAPNLTFVKADAFTYRPPQTVDILVCDVIAYPERNITLLETWLKEGLCQAFVVTLKFRGADDYVKVDACKSVLERYASSFVLRQLFHNKNEVTAAGFRRCP